MKKALLFIALITVVFSACNKYTDGPSISLHTKKHRLVNDWAIEQVFETPSNGTRTDKTTDYKNYYYDWNLSIKKNEDYILNYRILNFSPYSESGRWNFNSSNTNVFFVNANGNNASIGSNWTILRLKEKELWMETLNSSNNIIVEAHFIPR